MHGVSGDHTFRFVEVVSPGVQGPFIARRVAARYLEAVGVAFRVLVARGVEIDPHFIDTFGTHPGLLGKPFAKARAEKSVVQEERSHVGSDADELRGEVRVPNRRRNVENGLNKPEARASLAPSHEIKRSPSSTAEGRQRSARGATPRSASPQ